MNESATDKKVNRAYAKLRQNSAVIKFLRQQLAEHERRELILEALYFKATQSEEVSPVFDNAKDALAYLKSGTE